MELPSTEPEPTERIDNTNIRIIIRRYLLRGDDEPWKPIGTWDVSRVRDMSYAFFDKQTFNEDISDWDVSRVKDMTGMFCKAAVFNQDLNKWGPKLNNVTTMNAMFNDAISFNGKIDTWDVSNVENMFMMFENAKSFNQDICKWNVSKVKDMSRMFFNATSFNRNLSCWNDKITKSTLTKDMFRKATAYNDSITKTAKVHQLYRRIEPSSHNNKRIPNPIISADVQVMSNPNLMEYIEKYVGPYKFEPSAAELGAVDAAENLQPYSDLESDVESNIAGGGFKKTRTRSQKKVRKKTKSRRSQKKKKKQTKKRKKTNSNR